MLSRKSARRRQKEQSCVDCDRAVFTLMSMGLSSHLCIAMAAVEDKKNHFHWVVAKELEE